MRLVYFRRNFILFVLRGASCDENILNKLIKFDIDAIMTRMQNDELKRILVKQNLICVKWRRFKYRHVQLINQPKGYIQQLDQ